MERQPYHLRITLGSFMNHKNGIFVDLKDVMLKEQDQRGMICVCQPYNIYEHTPLRWYSLPSQGFNL